MPLPTQPQAAAPAAPASAPQVPVTVVIPETVKATVTETSQGLDIELTSKPRPKTRVTATRFPMFVHHQQVLVVPGRPSPVELDGWVQTQIDAGNLRVEV
jgi:hypothetical protein